jgi:hypothetical protein
MVLGAEEEESPLEANEDKVALKTLSKLSSSSLSSSSSSSSLLSPSPSLPSKEKENLHPPHLLRKCQCNAWVSVSSSSSSLSSLSPLSEDESKGRSNRNPEGELFFPQTTLLQDAILAKDNCDCEQDMT